MPRSSSSSGVVVLRSAESAIPADFTTDWRVGQWAVGSGQWAVERNGSGGGGGLLPTAHCERAQRAHCPLTLPTRNPDFLGKLAQLRLGGACFLLGRELDAHAEDRTFLRCRAPFDVSGVEPAV